MYVTFKTWALEFWNFMVQSSHGFKFNFLNFILFWKTSSWTSVGVWMFLPNCNLYSLLYFSFIELLFWAVSVVQNSVS